MPAHREQHIHDDPTTPHINCLKVDCNKSPCRTVGCRPIQEPCRAWYHISRKGGGWRSHLKRTGMIGQNQLFLLSWGLLAHLEECSLEWNETVPGLRSLWIIYFPCMYSTALSMLDMISEASSSWIGNCFLVATYYAKEPPSMSSMTIYRLFLFSQTWITDSKYSLEFDYVKMVEWLKNGLFECSILQYRFRYNLLCVMVINLNSTVRVVVEIDCLVDSSKRSLADLDHFLYHILVLQIIPFVLAEHFKLFIMDSFCDDHKEFSCVRYPCFIS
jgi:hypothetical protein